MVVMFFPVLPERVSRRRVSRNPYFQRVHACRRPVGSLPGQKASLCDAGGWRGVRTYCHFVL